MTDKPKLFHPCKETCSGYKQGYEDGFKDAERRLTESSFCACGEVNSLSKKDYVYENIVHRFNAPCYQLEAGTLRPEGQ